MKESPGFEREAHARYDRNSSKESREAEERKRKVRQWCLARVKERRANALWSKRLKNGNIATHRNEEIAEEASTSDPSEFLSWDEAISLMSHQEYLDIMLAIEKNVEGITHDEEECIEFWEVQNCMSSHFQVLCPLCKATYLWESYGFICCTCGLQIPSEHPGFGLQVLKERLAILWETHSSTNCPGTLDVLMHEEEDTTGLCVRCSQCQFLNVVIPSDHRQRINSMEQESSAEAEKGENMLSEKGVTRDEDGLDSITLDDDDRSGEGSKEASETPQPVGRVGPNQEGNGLNADEVVKNTSEPMQQFDVEDEHGAGMLDPVEVESAEFWADQKQLWDAWEQEKNELEKRIEYQMRQLESLGEASRDVSEMFTQRTPQDSMSSLATGESETQFSEDDDELDAPQGMDTSVKSVATTRKIMILSDITWKELFVKLLEAVFVIMLVRWICGLYGRYNHFPLSSQPS